MQNMEQRVIQWNEVGGDGNKYQESINTRTGKVNVSFKQMYNHQHLQVSERKKKQPK